LGLIRHYRRLNNGYETLAIPLTNLLKKENFHYDHTTTITFQELKVDITHAQILLDLSQILF